MESKKFEESLKKLLKWNEIKKVYCYFEFESKKNEFRCYSHEHKKKGHEIKINEVYQKISKLIKSSNDLQTPIDYLSCDSLKKLAKDEPCISEYREGKYYLFLKIPMTQEREPLEIKKQQYNNIRK